MFSLKELFFICLLVVLFFIPTQNVFSGDFDYQRFEDKNTNKYGFKDSSGNIVISAKFDFANDFNEGLACVGLGEYSNRKWGFINKTGKLVISAKFDYAYGFSEGLAFVAFGRDSNSKFGYINKNGKLVIPAKFDMAYNFKGGLADATIGNDKVKINTQGVVVWRENNNSSNNSYSTPQKTQKEIEDCQLNAISKQIACEVKGKHLSDNDGTILDSSSRQKWNSACYSQMQIERNDCTK